MNENYPSFAVENEKMTNFKTEFLLTVNNLFFKADYQGIITLVNEKYPELFYKHKDLLLVLYKLNLFEMLIRGESNEALISFYQDYIVSLFNVEEIESFKSTDYFIQKILANPDSVKVRSFYQKIQDICKLFLIVLEDILRFTYWSQLYHDSTNYTSFEIFKDYYEDANFYIDRNKLFKIEEDVWTNYAQGVMVIEDGGSGANLFSIDNYGFHCNFLTYDMELDDLNLEMEQYRPKDVDVISTVNTVNTTVNSTSNKINNKSKKQIPILKDLIVKFTKRENVDKKILRKFRKFLKDTNKKGQLPELSYFWNIFTNDNLLPPVDFNNINLGENVSFKSFNTTYMMWLFGHEGGVPLYELFLNSKHEAIFGMFSDLCKTDQDEIELKNYIINFAYIYSGKDQPTCADDYTNNTYVQLQTIEEVPETYFANNNEMDNSCAMSPKKNRVHEVVFDIEDPLKLYLNTNLRKFSSFEKPDALEKMFNHSYDDFDMFCEE